MNDHDEPWAVLKHALADLLRDEDRPSDLGPLDDDEPTFAEDFADAE